MTLDALLARLEGVRPRGNGRWSARCPAHPDKSPSLAIREGERGRILLHDFGGCAPREIVDALGLELRDLFADAPLPRGQRPPLKPLRVDRVALAFRFDLAALDHKLRAERILGAATGLDASRLNENELDRSLQALSVAYQSIERAEFFEGVADTLRLRAWGESRCRP